MKQKVIVLNQPGCQELMVPFVDEGETIEVLGLIVGRTPGDYVLKVTADHLIGHTFGRVVVKGIAQNGACLKVFGLVKIRPESQGVDDFLEMRLLVMDQQSQATAQPQLEIEANEVKASHAAAVGQIDQEQLFYLMSRGLTSQKAEETIVRGFLSGVVARIVDKNEQKKVKKMLS